MSELLNEWMGYSLIHSFANPLIQTCGERRIRTFVAEATDLQSVPFDRSGISPVFYFGYQTQNFRLTVKAKSEIEISKFEIKTEPPIGIEPMTY